MSTPTTTREHLAALWFPAVQTAPDAELILFCLPYAGGSTMAYRGWGERLAPRIQVRPAALPGREVRVLDPPAIGVAELARAMAAAADRPYAVYGHSMGARLALDVAAALLELGAPPPERIIVGGARPPHRALLTRLAHLPDELFMRRVLDLGGMAREIFDEPELRALLLPILRSDFAMIEDRKIRPPDPVPVPITAVAGVADPQAEPADMVGWAAHGSAGFELHTLPGEHFFLHSHQDRLLDLLTRVLHPDGRDPAGHQPLDPDEVLVIDARLDGLPELVAATGELSAGEADRAASLRDPGDSARFVARSVLSRRVLAAHGLAAGRAEYVRGDRGKPAWPSPGDLRFNASHSAGIALLALSPGRELGIDVERRRPMADLEAFAGGALDAGERAEFDELAGAAALDYALRIWTAKESVLKFTGDGLGVEPDVFGFAGHTGLTRWRAGADPGYERLTAAEVRHLDLTDGIGALALPVDDAEVRLRFVQLGTEVGDHR